MGEDRQKAMKGMPDPKYHEVTEGNAEVRAFFRLPKNEQAAGLMITEGKASRNSRVRLLRSGTVIFDGTIASLKRFKDDVRDVSQGYECGISLDGVNDFQEGDTLEFYKTEQVKQ